MSQSGEYSKLSTGDKPGADDKMIRADALEREIQDLGSCHWQLSTGWRLGSIVTILIICAFFYSNILSEVEAVIYSLAVVVLFILMVCENLYRYIKTTHKRIDRTVDLIHLLRDMTK